MRLLRVVVVLGVRIVVASVCRLAALRCESVSSIIIISLTAIVSTVAIMTMARNSMAPSAIGSTASPSEFA